MTRLCPECGERELVLTDSGFQCACGKSGTLKELTDVDSNSSIKKTTTLPSRYARLPDLNGVRRKIEILGLVVVPLMTIIGGGCVAFLVWWAGGSTGAAVVSGSVAGIICGFFGLSGVSQRLTTPISPNPEKYSNMTKEIAWLFPNVTRPKFYVPFCCPSCQTYFRLVINTEIRTKEPKKRHCPQCQRAIDAICWFCGKHEPNHQHPHIISHKFRSSIGSRGATGMITVSESERTTPVSRCGECYQRQRRISSHHVTYPLLATTGIAVAVVLWQWQRGWDFRFPNELVERGLIVALAVGLLTLIGLRIYHRFVYSFRETKTAAAFYPWSHLTLNHWNWKVIEEPRQTTPSDN